MRLTTALIVGVTLAASSTASAQVTGVLTHTSAIVQFRPGADPVAESGTINYSGFPKIADSQGSNEFGSGGSFASTSDIGPAVIEFQNGNAASGTKSAVTSRTVVDITFRNDGPTAVTPVLHSTITPAGLGFYTSPSCLGEVSSCGPGMSYPGDFRDFQDFAGSGDIASASFLFRISGDGETLYELSGMVALVYDPVAGKNVTISEFGLAQTELDGFHLTSPIGSEHEFGFGWDATDILVNFPTGTLLEPGEFSTLTYETVVTSVSNTPCFGQLTNACITAYSSFGDPVGRGGSVRPTLMPFSTLAEEPRVSFDTFNFAMPTFRNGVLSFELIQPTLVPECRSWALMILGLAMLGSTLRRRRALSFAAG